MVRLHGSYSAPVKAGLMLQLQVMCEEREQEKVCLVRPADFVNLIKRMHDSIGNCCGVTLYSRAVFTRISLNVSVRSGFGIGSEVPNLRHQFRNRPWYHFLGRDGTNVDTDVSVRRCYSTYPLLLMLSVLKDPSFIYESGRIRGTTGSCSLKPTLPVRMTGKRPSSSSLRYDLAASIRRVHNSDLPSFNDQDAIAQLHDCHLVQFKRPEEHSEAGSPPRSDLEAAPYVSSSIMPKTVNAE